MSTPRPRIIFVQHGDFRETWETFRAGGAESYRDQRRSVTYVGDLRDRFDVTVVAIGPRDDMGQLEEGLWVRRIPRADMSHRRMRALFDELRPDLMVLRTPNLPMLHQARRRAIPTLPCFADIFRSEGLRGALWNLRLRHAVRPGIVPCVANHSRNASRSLVTAVGIAPERVVPWDWSRLDVVPEVKDGVRDPKAPRVFYAGKLAPEKGVGDLLEAIAALRADGLAAAGTFAGPGDQDPWRAQAQTLGIADAVTFPGRLEHAQVRQMMRDHDAVVVPSRHAYPEGLPNTIYEGLASRTALLLSDHPAFAGRLQDQRDGLIFRGSDPADLAEKIRMLCENPSLYREISSHAGAAVEQLYFGMEWDRLVSLFLADPLDKTGWVKTHALGTRDEMNGSSM